MVVIMAHTMNKMIDIHNHSLHSVDDGAKDLKEAITNIKYLSSLGFKDIILTSHYNFNLNYTKNVLERITLLKELKSSTKELNVNLYLGNEVYINEANALITLLNENKITTLNHSKYLLIELPFNQKINHVENIICELNEVGITPIIAHSERYSYFNLEDIKKLLEYDCLLQCNLTSLVGHYGKHAKKQIKKLLKAKLVSFLATDFHHLKNKNIKKSLRKLNRILTKEEQNKLLYENPLKVLENQNINN